MFDIIIIGSGPAGLSAAIYAKRANLNVAVAEKEYEGTGQISESGNVNNYLSIFHSPSCVFSEFLTAKSSTVNTLKRMENYITDYDSL